MEQEAQDEQESRIIIESAASTMDSLQDQPSHLDEVEQILGYNFKSKCLLEEAFTHSSYYYTKDNNYNDEAEIKCFSSFERLAYLGDAVLNLLVAKEQFLYSDFSSGRLTRLQAANVDIEKLAHVAVEHGLHCYLCHKKPLLVERMNGFKKEILEYPIHSNGLVVPKCLADLVESIIGAIFIDSDANIDIVWQVFRRLLEPLIDAETLKTHPVTEPYQICQKYNLTVQFKD